MPFKDEIESWLVMTPAPVKVTTYYGELSPVMTVGGLKVDCHEVIGRTLPDVVAVLGAHDEIEPEGDEICVEFDAAGMSIYFRDGRCSRALIAGGEV